MAGNGCKELGREIGILSKLLSLTIMASIGMHRIAVLQYVTFLLIVFTVKSDIPRKKRAGTIKILYLVFAFLSLILGTGVQILHGGAQRRAISLLTADWTTTAWIRLSQFQKLALGSLFVLIAALYWPVWWLAQHVRSRDETASPTRLRKALAASAGRAATASVPIVAVLALGCLVDLFDLPTQFQAIGPLLTIGVAVVAISTGLARGLLAPKSPNWRLPPLCDLGARALYHATISVTVVVAIQKFVEAINEVIAVGLPTAVATRGLGALAVAFVLLHQIRKGAGPRAAIKDTSRTPQMEHWAPCFGCSPGRSRSRCSARS